MRSLGGRALAKEWGAQSLTLLGKTTNSYFFLLAVRLLGAKVLSREGNNPDRWLRPLNCFLVGKEVLKQRRSDGGLGSSHPLKKA